jgi:hypothetical protein
MVLFCFPRAQAIHMSALLKEKRSASINQLTISERRASPVSLKTRRRGGTGLPGKSSCVHGLSVTYHMPKRQLTGAPAVSCVPCPCPDKGAGVHPAVTQSSVDQASQPGPAQSRPPRWFPAALEPAVVGARLSDHIIVKAIR